MTAPTDVVIVAAKRTPVGSFLGAFAATPAHELGRMPRKGESVQLGGLQFVVLHTKGGAVRWFKVAPASAQDTDAEG